MCYLQPTLPTPANAVAHATHTHTKSEINRSYLYLPINKRLNVFAGTEDNAERDPMHISAREHYRASGGGSEKQRN